VWGEALGRVFADTHGLSVICIRIGGVEDEDEPLPQGWSTAVWCSKRDVAQMVERAIQAPDDLRYDVFYAVSDNKWRWVDIGHGREVLGYVPQDSTEARRAEMKAESDADE